MNVYDFDKTIYKNDSTVDFYLYSLIHHPRILIYFPGVVAGFIKYYLLKKGTKTEFKGRIMRFASCISHDDIESFWDKNRHKIKEFYINQQRDDDVIISASPRFLLEPLCRSLGIAHLIASEIDIKTGRFDSPNCCSTEKVRRFSELFDKNDIDSFYSDSTSDAPMARLAKTAYLVRGERIFIWNIADSGNKISNFDN